MVSSKSLLKHQVYVVVTLNIHYNYIVEIIHIFRLPSTRQDLEEDNHGENHLEGNGSFLKTAVFGGLDGS